MTARRGLFGAAYGLQRRSELPSALHEQLERHLDWFERNLTVPEKFNRTKSKGAYRRKTKGLSWFKPNAHEVLAKCRDLVALLEINDCAIDVIYTRRIGYIVYEDEFQVVAEPFFDTPI